MNTKPGDALWKAATQIHRDTPPAITRNPHGQAAREWCAQQNTPAIPDITRLTQQHNPPHPPINWVTLGIAARLHTQATQQNKTPTFLEYIRLAHAIAGDPKYVTPTHSNTTHHTKHQEQNKRSEP